MQTQKSTSATALKLILDTSSLQINELKLYKRFPQQGDFLCYILPNGRQDVVRNIL
jgi:hypothetical protein